MWTTRRHLLCRRPTFPKSVPISLFLSEWFRDSSFRKLVPEAVAPSGAA